MVLDESTGDLMEGQKDKQLSVNETKPTSSLEASISKRRLSFFGRILQRRKRRERNLKNRSMAGKRSPKITYQQKVREAIRCTFDDWFKPQVTGMHGETK